MVLRRVLVVDDEENIRTSLKGVLEDEGFKVSTAAEGQSALEQVSTFSPDVILLDIWMPGDDGIQVLERIKRRDPHAVVVMMSGHGTVETAVKAIKLGAFDFLEKPIHFDKVLVVLERAFEIRELRDENRFLREALHGGGALIGESDSMKRLQQLIQLAGPSNGWALIQGENGTGKELVARTLHQSSPRAGGRFVAVNCAAVPEELIESELFGHEKGSFTGAFDRKIGKFEQAHGGTLFLDEVGDMGPKMQAKILRALQECSIQRVGGQEPIELDIRVIAATNKDLKGAISVGEFREDLFYRLNVIPIQVPPLRERRKDIPFLVNHFLKLFSGGKKRTVSPDTMQRLCDYPWPGNVRELKNWVERACILSTGETVDLSLVEDPQGTVISTASLNSANLREARADFEKKFIAKWLKENDGNISKTAQMIGLERSHLHKKMRTYGIRELSNN